MALYLGSNKKCKIISNGSIKKLTIGSAMKPIVDDTAKLGKAIIGIMKLGGQ